MAKDMGQGAAVRRNRWRLPVWGGAAALLLLPAIAMQFTREVNWTASDFIVMGALLSGACGAYELGARMSGNSAYRGAFAVAIVTAFLTVWVNAAVGMLGDEGNPENLIFGGVLLVGMAGALLAFFRPRGMAIAMFATAAAQALTVVYALLAGHAQVAVLIGLFVLPWLLSAQLFLKAAREQAGEGARA